MGSSIKDPEHEAEKPAPMPTGVVKPDAPTGPNTQGNDRSDIEQDPEGQQGGPPGDSKK